MTEFPTQQLPEGMRLTRDWANRTVLVPATRADGSPSEPWSNLSVIEDIQTGELLPVTPVDQQILWVDEEGNTLRY